MRTLSLVTLSLLAGLGAFSLGCGNKLRTTVAPEFSSRVTPVQSLAVGGPGAADATQAFLELGYAPFDVGGSPSDAIQQARNTGASHLAIADATDSSVAVWNGFYTFGLRLSDTQTGRVVWSGSATWGEGGVFINQQTSTKYGYLALVKDLAKHFPPEAGIKQPKTQPTWAK